MLKRLLAAAALALVPMIAFADPVEITDPATIMHYENGALSVTITEEALSEAGWQRAPAIEPPEDSPLAFPDPRGTVLFEHQWQTGDVPEILQTASDKKGTTYYLGGDKFIVRNPAGSYAIVKDDETEQAVLRLVVTRENDAKFGHHHTELLPYLPDDWISGQYMIRGERYILEMWRKDIDYAPDGKWEIWMQGTSKQDDTRELPRNPAWALSSGRTEEIGLTLRAITAKIGASKVYDREERFDLGPVESDVWTLWQIELLYDHAGGAMHVWRNGDLVHTEEGQMVGYNDPGGPRWKMGIYRWFSGGTTNRREAYIGPVRVQHLN